MSGEPDFFTMATAFRKMYEVVDEKARALPDALALDEAERDVTEIVVFVTAACLASHEHGLPREALRAMLDSIIDDVWGES